MLKILKASAGSGKTFTLAGEYIRLLFAVKPDKDEERTGDACCDPHAYRHILAVTFTNKATDEMKSRILKELHVLATTPAKSSYIAEIMTMRKDLSQAAVASMARRFLCNILNDYGAFSVSTIDSFFQRTLKAFSREIGQFSSYQVELDKASLVKESVDRILDSLTDKDKKLLKWLSDSVMEQLNKDGKFSIENQLYNMAAALHDEGHRTLAEKLALDDRKIYSRDNLTRLREGCRKVIDGFAGKVSASASSVLDALDNAGVQPEEFNRKFLAKIRDYVNVTARKLITAPTDAFLRNSADPELWFAKSKAGLRASVEGKLEEPLGRFCSLFNDEYRTYKTALALLDQIYSLGLAGELEDSFNDLVKEKNVMSLDDSNTILRDIIDGSDAPFIYEKIGVRYDHFLLDEFQDTSCIQWENFRPLLSESLAGGNSNLIVGDVKQSIYRWRNSDWNLLNSRLYEEFPGEYEKDVLGANWRSVDNVVEFNNCFYEYAAAALDSISGGSRIRDIYSDVRQAKRSRDASKGNVDVMFCREQDQVRAVIAEIHRLVENGATYADIGILVRTNAIGAAIASSLLADSIPVISDEALCLKASPAVRRIVALLSFVDNPDDSLNAYLVSSLKIAPPEQCHSLVDMCEHFIRELKLALRDDLSGESAYLQAFMDIVREWASSNGNSIRVFLSYWDQADPKISSPDSADSVRVMTVHKSKGLDFNYVIFPFSENCNLFKATEKWCRPSVEGTELESCADGIYRVSLSSKMKDTLFSDSYDEEYFMQIVDSLNTYYVATTRARNGMTIISKMPSDSFLKALGERTGNYPGAVSDISQLLYGFVRHPSFNPGFREISKDGEDPLRLRLGEAYPFASSSVAEPGSTSGYPSWPLAGRLEFSGEARDFFTGDDVPGGSGRLKGIVLHDILSRVRVPSDLEAAVRESFNEGAISEADIPEIASLLSSRIASVEDRRWFAGDLEIERNEVTVIDSDGEIYRPDRVVIDGGSVQIIDYKFGRPSSEYEAQVRNYARLYREMGYSDVKSSLWYVRQGRIVDVE